jgi:hypothetical protein
VTLDRGRLAGFEDLLDAPAQPDMKMLRGNVEDIPADDLSQFLAWEAVGDQDTTVAVELGNDVGHVFEDRAPSLEQSLIRTLGDRHAAASSDGGSIARRGRSRFQPGRIHWSLVDGRPIKV